MALSRCSNRLRFQMSMGQGEWIGRSIASFAKERGGIDGRCGSAQGVKTPVVMAAPKGAVPAKGKKGAKARKPRAKQRRRTKA